MYQDVVIGAKNCGISHSLFKFVDLSPECKYLMIEPVFMQNWFALIQALTVQQVSNPTTDFRILKVDVRSTEAFYMSSLFQPCDFINKQNGNEVPRPNQLLPNKKP